MSEPFKMVSVKRLDELEAKEKVYEDALERCKRHFMYLVRAEQSGAAGGKIEILPGDTFRVIPPDLFDENIVWEREEHPHPMMDLIQTALDDPNEYKRRFIDYGEK